MDWFLNYMQEYLSEQEYSQIKYAVVQSGTRLDLSTRTNVGNFNNGRLLHEIHNVQELQQTLHLPDKFQQYER